MRKKAVSKIIIIFVILIIIVGLLLIAVIRRSHPNNLVNRNPSNISTLEKDSEYSINFQNQLRKYLVHIPPSYNKDTPIPVVIYLHGGGGSIQAGYNDKMPESSDKLGFILVIPAGTGNSVLKDRLLFWNSGLGNNGKCCSNSKDQTADDVGFITKVIEEVENNFNVDSKRIYVTGLSNGGMMSYRLACELSDKIAAIAAVAAPAIPDNCNPLRKVPVMHVHGTADPCAFYNGGLGDSCLGGKPIDSESALNQVNFWIKKDDCSEFSTNVYNNGNANCVLYSQCKDNSEVEFCTINGMGHAWPSGNQYLPAKTIGPVSYDMSFDQIWDFLKRHYLG